MRPHDSECVIFTSASGIGTTLEWHPFSIRHREFFVRHGILTVSTNRVDRCFPGIMRTTSAICSWIRDTEPPTSSTTVALDVLLKCQFAFPISFGT